MDNQTCNKTCSKSNWGNSVMKINQNYKLNKIQAQAIQYYRQKHKCQVCLSLLPEITFKKDDKEFKVDIRQITSEYLANEN